MVRAIRKLTTMFFFVQTCNWMCRSYLNFLFAISETDVTLHRKNKAQIRWPLGSLRRYGFDANFFTFEAGRRCESGPGIFSFKCQRADVLFSTFQSYIQRAYINDESTGSDFVVPNASNRNIAQLNSLNLGVGTLHSQGIQGSSYIVNNRPNSSLSPVGTNSIQSRSTDTLTADYLEPNPTRPLTTSSQPTRFSSNRMSSFGSVSPSSPTSPNSYTNILEITNLSQSHHQQLHAQGNIYQDYPSGYTQKSVQKNLDIPPVEEAPTIDQQQLKAAAATCTMMKTTPKNDPSTNVYMNAEIGASSSGKFENESKRAPPTPRQATLAEMENLEVEPEESTISSPDSVKLNTALYMNVAIGGVDENNLVCPVITPPACSTSSGEMKENQPPVAITPPMLTNNLNSKINDVQKDYTKNMNGNIFGFTRALSFTQDQNPSTTRCYENLDVGNLTEMKPLILRNARNSRPEIFSKVDLPLVDRNDRSEPCTPTQRKVNYIVLDLDQPNHNINNSNNYNNSITSRNVIGMISVSNNNINGSADNCSSDNGQSQMVNSASATSGLILPETESPKKLGYATIDFDRSNALSNILQNNPINDFDQSCRKTRHDSNVALIAMKHSNSMSD